MSDNENQQPEEIQFLEIKGIRAGDAPVEGKKTTSHEEEAVEHQKTEEFWAGRNHAMRRSARVAA